jgi:adenylate cyclase class 2
MGPGDRETEAKFLVPQLPEMRRRLLAAGARSVTPRTLELNLRFDDDQGRLQQAGRVLRLRRDRSAYLTFKAPGPVPEERAEIELEIDDPETGRRFLESLGFHVVATYEKYRQVFSLDASQVMLDELPFGTFIEVEGESLESIRRTATALGLAWEHRVRASYLDVFDALRPHVGLTTREATFAAFEAVPPVAPSLLESLCASPSSEGASP